MTSPIRCRNWTVRLLFRRAGRVGVILGLVCAQWLAGEVVGVPSRHAVRGGGRVVEDIGNGMGVGEGQIAVGFKKRRGDPGPGVDVGKPAEGAPTDEDPVEGCRLVDCGFGIVDVGFHETRAVRKVEFDGECVRGSRGPSLARPPRPRRAKRLWYPAPP